MEQTGNIRWIRGDEIRLGDILEPTKDAGYAPVEGWYHGPVRGWTVTGIDGTRSEDGRQAILLHLEWGSLWEDACHHTNTTAWCWGDEAAFAINVREDVTE